MDKGKPLKPKGPAKDKATANAKTAANEAERHKIGETPAKAAKKK
ncbi:hypothetical protein [Aureimonas endophytica]|nr:hypothetical protein [Aureimonas endophytica]